MTHRNDAQTAVGGRATVTGLTPCTQRGCPSYRWDGDACGVPCTQPASWLVRAGRAGTFPGVRPASVGGTNKSMFISDVKITWRLIFTHCTMNYTACQALFA